MEIACIGVGVIGQSWTALFLSAGFAVRAWDPGPGWEERLREALARYAPNFQAMGLPDDFAELRRCSTLEEAVGGACLIQESAPERLDLKRSLLAEIEAAADGQAILASSTSGLMPDDLAASLLDPGRFLVAHPFSPPHLVPAMDIAGASVTRPDVIDRAVSIYRAAGKIPVVMRRPAPGFIGNRLQAAMLREAFHMLAAGEATMREIDLVVTRGPGLRWPYLGPCEGEIDWMDPSGSGDVDDHRYGLLMHTQWSRLRGPDLTPEFRAVLQRQMAERRAQGPIEGPHTDRRLLAVRRAVEGD